MVKKEILEAAPDNQLIRNTMQKADLLLDSYKNPVCSVSGGSDSDIMLDLLERVRNGRPIHYVFFDTGIEYAATKKHLDELDAKYGIKIERRNASVPVPLGCKRYGNPFLSKDVSQKIEMLQRHNFQWEDESYEVLVQKYERCTSALKWWCNQKNPKYDIQSYRGLKEFLIKSPPDFMISDHCCRGAKKDPAKEYYKEVDCCLKIIGERRAEGGVRSSKHQSCFDPIAKGEIPSYRPLWFWTDEDKQQYKEHYGMKYSDCYEVYGLKRTGCAGCPFNSQFDDALALIHQFEPRLEVAVTNIFGKSYDYTHKYREFKAELAGKRKKKKEIDSEKSELSADSN